MPYEICKLSDYMVNLTEGGAQIFLVGVFLLG